MTISIASNNVLGLAEYEALRYALIAQLEAKKTLPYFDTATNPLITIGVGFNIDNNPQRRNQVIAALGLSPVQSAGINGIWTSPELADIRDDPHVTAAEQQAQNQRLENLFTQTLRSNTTAQLSAQQIQDILSGVAANLVVAGITLDAQIHLNATQQTAVAGLWGSPALTTIQGMPVGTQTERDAQSQALTDLINQAVRSVTVFSMTDGQMKSVFDDIVGAFDDAAQSKTGVTTLSAERAVLASLEYNSKPSDPLLCI
ncbi:MAG: hypothetical protein PHV02_16310 [Rhodocyclaceae bacterium]|nr:hypothetical protein [Rhodocyclaceae bacterium]